MAKKVYVGINNKARQGKKMYLGVDNIARKVKKGYIGIGGVARPFFGGGVVYYGSVTDLSAGRAFMGATSIGDYALFGGGSTGLSEKLNYNNVDTYNSSLTHGTRSLSVARTNLAAASVGNYALFSGGQIYKETDESSTAVYQMFDTVDVFDTALTRSNQVKLSVARSSHGRVTIGNYALFISGISNPNSGNISTQLKLFDAFTASLSRIERTLSWGSEAVSATPVGDYAVCIGGYTNLTTIDKSLTQTNKARTSRNAYQNNATTLGNYAILGTISGAVVYDGSLTEVALLPETSGLWTTLDEFALVAGESAAHVYDKSLTRIDNDEVRPTTSGVGGMSAVTIGNYALYTNKHSVKTVDAYTIT